jgi:Protein of unknown function (DUF2946)
MRTNGVLRRLGSRVAIFAIVWAALAPTLTLAVQSSGTAGWVELCSALGSRWIKTTGLDTGVPQPTSHGGEHCPYCTLPSLGLVPTPPVAGEPGLVLTYPQPRFAAEALIPGPAWRAAQPRGPPHRA